MTRLAEHAAHVSTRATKNDNDQVRHRYAKVGLGATLMLRMIAARGRASKGDQSHPGEGAASRTDGARHPRRYAFPSPWS